MSDDERKFEKLSALIDGELTSADTWDLEKAIETDPELAGELRALRATRDVLRKLPAERAPEDFANRILERAERHRLMHYPSAEKALRASRWITAAAAAIVLIGAGFGGYMMIQSWPPPQGDTNIAFTPAAPEGGAVDMERSEVALPGKGGVVGKNGDPYAAKVGEADRDGGGIVSKGGTPGPGGGLAAKPAGPVASKKYGGKGGGGSGGPALLTENLVFDTSNLALARRDVEAVLAFNGLQPAVLEIADNMGDAVAIGGFGKGVVTQRGAPGAPLRSASSRAAVYQRDESERQIQFDVYVSPDQMEKVKGEVLAQLTGLRPEVRGKLGVPDYLAKLDANATLGGQIGVSNASFEQRATMLDKAMLKEADDAPAPAKPSKVAAGTPAPEAPRAIAPKAKTAKPSTDDATQTVNGMGEQIARKTPALTKAAPAKEEETPSDPNESTAWDAKQTGAETEVDPVAKAKPAEKEATTQAKAAVGAKKRPADDGGGLARQKDQPTDQQKLAAASQPESAANQAGAQSEMKQIAQQALQQSRIGANLQRLVITLNLAPAVRTEAVEAEVRAKEAAAKAALKEQQQAPPAEK
jgi:negative regulator of sigma E activity